MSREDPEEGPVDKLLEEATEVEGLLEQELQDLINWPSQSSEANEEEEVEEDQATQMVKKEGDPPSPGDPSKGDPNDTTEIELPGGVKIKVRNAPTADPVLATLHNRLKRPQDPTKFQTFAETAETPKDIKFTFMSSSLGTTFEKELQLEDNYSLSMQLFAVESHLTTYDMMHTFNIVKLLPNSRPRATIVSLDGS